MKNKKGSAIIWALITMLFCIIIITQIGSKILSYTKQNNDEINSEQVYLTSIDSANIFADEICNNTETGTKILNSLVSGNSLVFENIVPKTNCNCNLKIEMPQQNKIKISSRTNKNDYISNINLNLLLDETTSPATWTIKNYEKEQK